jgi:hypothetical protein
MLDKGSYPTADGSRSAYTGLSMDLNHRGGKIDVFLPCFDPSRAIGKVHFTLLKRSSDLGYLQNVAVAAELKQDYLKGFSPSVRSHVLGQDYILICMSTRLAKMLGYDNAFKVAFAWPSDVHGVLAPISGFEYGQDLDLQAQLVSNIGEHNGECSPQIILFPVIK